MHLCFLHCIWVCFVCDCEALTVLLQCTCVCVLQAVLEKLSSEKHAKRAFKELQSSVASFLGVSHRTTWPSYRMLVSHRATSPIISRHLMLFVQVPTEGEWCGVYVRRVAGITCTRRSSYRCVFRFFERPSRSPSHTGV